jgi:hypothetical protein
MQCAGVSYTLAETGDDMTDRDPSEDAIESHAERLAEAIALGLRDASGRLIQRQPILATEPPDQEN